jgi:SAM-dependent methyltransferase
MDTLTTYSTRRPYQGVQNIVRFNWPFFVEAGLAILGLLVAASYAPPALRGWLLAGAGLAGLTTLVSLGVSHYVYDRAGFYALGWLGTFGVEPGTRVVNINAGFDETSAVLAQTYPQATLRVYDFYDPARHTEPSIERARRTYPAYPGTVRIETAHIPEATASADTVCLLFAAHEIRDDAERAQFFREVARVLTPTGRAVVVEHLRDVPNFLAYTIGFLHFHSRRTWLTTFHEAGLSIETETPFTPFVRVFSVQKL